jgi:hypothetical protein
MRSGTNAVLLLAAALVAIGNVAGTTAAANCTAGNLLDSQQSLLARYLCKVSCALHQPLLCGKCAYGDGVALVGAAAGVTDSSSPPCLVHAADELRNNRQLDCGPPDFAEDFPNKESATVSKLCTAVRHQPAPVGGAPVLGLLLCGC